MKGLVFMFALISSFASVSQVGIGTVTPNPSSVLEVSASDKGILIPKLALGNSSDTTLDGVNLAATGLLIYNTNASTTGGSGVGYYYFNGSSWERLVTSATSIDDADWTINGADIQRQSGDVYVGSTSGTNNDLYISNRLVDWDNTAYTIDPASDNRMNEIEFDNGSLADPSIRFADINTGFYSEGVSSIAYGVNGTKRFGINAGGLISFGNSLALTNYTFPLVRGLTDQLLQSDGNGNLSWIDPLALDDGDWVDIGVDLERQSGDVYIGNTSLTNNDLWISDRIIDWDSSGFYLDPNSTSVVNEIEFSDGSSSDPSIRFSDTNTGFFQPVASELGYTANGTERLRIDSNGNLGIQTMNPQYALEVSGAIFLEDSVVPGSLANHSGIFSQSGELTAVDAVGNLTTISPHNFSLVESSHPMAWSFYSRNEEIGQQINVDMLKTVRLVEKLSGEKLINLADLDGNPVEVEIPIVDNNVGTSILLKEIENLKLLLQVQQKEIEDLKVLLKKKR
ncbi:MAG: hypothetical protein HKO54_09270 [Flavobacteriaceae bacterium]|nr:hypothetical protein [Flavobacteriaceae bacterium]